MRTFHLPSLVLLIVHLAGACSYLSADDRDAPRQEQAAAGFLSDPNLFPIAVWLQSPARATEYREAGINLYVGMWKGPTGEQLAELKRQGMYVICDQNEIGLQHRDDPTIVAWMHGDEPDNAQPVRGGKGYGPPILPAKIAESYRRMKERDPTRPILLNLGQGVAWDQWIGRGVHRNHPEDYLEYVRGGDIVSFDIYPACHDHPDVAGKLWVVADGVSRLRQWSGDGKRVWNCIECTRISNPQAKATPRQVKAEVWMSLVRGSQGLIYFVHQFKPRFIEAALLADAEMLAEVTAINKQIQSLAPVLNSPTISMGVTVRSSNEDVPIEAIVKRRGSEWFVFAVAMRGAAASAQLKLAGVTGSAMAEVLGESRSVAIHDGTIRDDFEPWGVHLYQIRSEE